MAGFGQLDVERRTLKGMTPEEQEALIRGEYLPDRLAEFKSTRDAEQQRLQSQLERTQQMIGDNPVRVPSNGAHPGYQLGALAANVLRSFGGMYLSGQKEKEMAAQQAASKQDFQSLMKSGEDATGAGLSTKKRGLAEALRGFGSTGYDL